MEQDSVRLEELLAAKQAAESELARWRAVRAHAVQQLLQVTREQRLLERAGALSTSGEGF